MDGKQDGGENRNGETALKKLPREKRHAVPRCKPF
jgi:hypothetical protein